MIKLTTIVDENDKEIGYKEDSLITRDDIYRATGLLIVNSQGQVLLAKRVLTKTHSPGKWAPAVAGTVEKGENYDSNIIKEGKEELGLDLDISELEMSLKSRVKLDWNYFAQIYFYKCDKAVAEFNFDKKEASELKWFSLTELKNEFHNHPEHFVPNFVNYYPLVEKRLAGQ